MAAKKIIVTHVESIAIHKILKADKGLTPLEEFIDLITKESGVERWIAEKFAAAWRWNHRDDASKEDQQKPNENYFVNTPLPQRSTNPAKGNGIVATILEHASKGKSVQEIIEMGFNKSTVYRQVGEWKKRMKSAS